MSRLQPYARVDLGVDYEFYGQVTYFGDSLSWPLASMLGTPGVLSTGFETDPTGQYLIQARQRFGLDFPTTLWTQLPGDTGSYSDWTDPATNYRGIYQTNGD